MIAHASIDENRRISGGIAGDQTKKEVCTRSWYNKPWGYVLRAYDPHVREKIARFMKQACENDFIGYNQAQRNTLHYELTNVNYDVRKVNKPCNTDCSALVSDACIFAGVPATSLYVGRNLSTTSTLRKRLDDTGMFEVIADKTITASESKLCKGDILLAEGHHVAVYIGKTVRPILRFGDTCCDVYALREKLIRFGIQIPKSTHFDTVCRNAVIEFQGYKGIEKDGIVGNITWSYIDEY